MRAETECMTFIDKWAWKKIDHKSRGFRGEFDGFFGCFLQDLPSICRKMEKVSGSGER
jgi:hypothetical protein